MQVHNVYKYQKYTTHYSDCNWTITVSAIWQLLLADFQVLVISMPFVLLFLLVNN